MRQKRFIRSDKRDVVRVLNPVGIPKIVQLMQGVKMGLGVFLMSEVSLRPSNAHTSVPWLVHEARAPARMRVYLCPELRLSASGPTPGGGSERRKDSSHGLPPVASRPPGVLRRPLTKPTSGGGSGQRKSPSAPSMPISVRVISLIRNRLPLGDYSRLGPYDCPTGLAFSYERGTPVAGLSNSGVALRFRGGPDLHLRTSLDTPYRGTSLIRFCPPPRL